MKTTYNCTLGEFNTKIAKYLYKNLGTPKAKLKGNNYAKFKYLNYSSEEGVSANVRIVPDYITKEDKYTLAVKVIISLEHDMNNKIKRGLERLLKK